MRLSFLNKPYPVICGIMAGQTPGELIAGAATVLLHLRWRNSLLSIFGGTVLYMVLIRTLFA